MVSGVQTQMSSQCFVVLSIVFFVLVSSVISCLGYCVFCFSSFLCFPNFSTLYYFYSVCNPSVIPCTHVFRWTGLRRVRIPRQLAWQSAVQTANKSGKQQSARQFLHVRQLREAARWNKMWQHGMFASGKQEQTGKLH